MQLHLSRGSFVLGALLAPLAATPLAIDGATLTRRALANGAVAAGPTSFTGSPSSGLVEIVGALHDHSEYSDGAVGSRPADYYAAGQQYGLDFMCGTEHSDFNMLPISTSSQCLSASIAQCVIADNQHPAAALQKWTAALSQAQAAASPRYSAMRGFEWSSDRFGHINVYFSKNYISAAIGTGMIEMQSFWEWFTALPPSVGGGTDGLATFNHPGLKCYSSSDPGCDWNDFAYVPAADTRMIGQEVFGYVDSDYGSIGPAEGYYAYALDKGWHLGAVGAEDLHSTTWAIPTHPKTVFLVPFNSPAAIYDAMLNRRFYAIRDTSLRLRFSVNGQIMGTRLGLGANSPLNVVAQTVDAKSGQPLLGTYLELITNGGNVLAKTGPVMNLSTRSLAGQTYVFVKAVRADGTPIAYSSPIWIGS
jgi:hypothetical protein